MSFIYSGQITVLNPSELDYETSVEMELVVMAVQGDDAVYTTVTVQLIDENDNQPIFGQDRYTSSVWEDNPRSTYVTKVSATDLDSGENGIIDYYIVRGNNEQAFEIDPPHTGIVKTTLMIDREIQSEFKLIVEAFDRGSPPKSSTCILKINVIDVNDNGPSFRVYNPEIVKEGKKIFVGNFLLYTNACVLPQ